MKKRLFILVLGLFALNIQAQLVLTTIGDGVVSVEYQVDIPFYDPLGEDHIYLYMWVNLDQTDPELPFSYTDEWTEPASFVQINWSVDDSKFIGEIDFNTHNFLGEGSINGGILINEFNLILRNEAGDHQSGDLLASDYGFTATQTLSQVDYQAEKASYYNNGTLFLNNLKTNEVIEVSIIDATGRKVYYTKKVAKQAGITIDLSHLSKSFAIVYVKTASNKYFTKKIVL